MKYCVCINTLLGLAIPHFDVFSASLIQCHMRVYLPIILSTFKIISYAHTCVSYLYYLCSNILLN